MSTKKPIIETARRRLDATRTSSEDCVGEEALVLLRDITELKLCIGDDAPATPVWLCVIVGQDDHGLWVEPLQWVEKARAGKSASVWHLLIPWSNIVGIMVDSNRTRPSYVSHWKNSSRKSRVVS